MNTLSSNSPTLELYYVNLDEYDDFSEAVVDNHRANGGNDHPLWVEWKAATNKHGYESDGIKESRTRIISLMVQQALTRMETKAYFQVNERDPEKEWHSGRLMFINFEDYLFFKLTFL